MTPDKAKLRPTPPKAYLNPEFMGSPQARSIRVLTEMTEGRLKDASFRAGIEASIPMGRVGNLSVGAPADVAVTRLETGDFGFIDVGGALVANRRHPGREAVPCRRLADEAERGVRIDRLRRCQLIHPCRGTSVAHAAAQLLRTEKLQSANAHALLNAAVGLVPRRRPDCRNLHRCDHRPLRLHRAR